MNNFTLKELNFTRCRRWIIEAKSKKDNDPVYSFIATWISFNHFYGTHASTNNKGFMAWSNKYMNSSHGDKAQLMYLIHIKQFVDFFNVFKAEKQKLFENEIVLPVINLLSGQAVPDRLKGNYRLCDLQPDQIFQIIYQIRNNLFHGEKDPFQNMRDKGLSQLGSSFMLALTSSLLSLTYGEELDAFDDQQQEEIRLVAEISKTIEE